MMYSLRGTLTEIENNFVVIECAGVGYKCLTSLYTKSKLSDKFEQEIKLYTYLNIRQDDVDLFGFADKSELECFKLLTSVSGVGPKAALSILSQYSSKQVASFITSGDSKSLTAVSGIGTKTAQRIVLELKDKMSKNGDSGNSRDIYFSASPVGSNASEAIKALSTLGYSPQDVSRFISSLDSKLTVEEIITLTLKSMAKKV